MLGRPCSTSSTRRSRPCPAARATVWRWPPRCSAPELLLLDEPAAGLDPEHRLQLRAILSEVGARGTVVVSTHHTAEAAALCRRVVVMLAGRVHFTGTPAELAAEASGRVWEDDTPGWPAGAHPGVAHRGGPGAQLGDPPAGAEVVEPTIDDGYLLVTANDPAAAMNATTLRQAAYPTTRAIAWAPVLAVGGLLLTVGAVLRLLDGRPGPFSRPGRRRHGRPVLVFSLRDPVEPLLAAPAPRPRITRRALRLALVGAVALPAVAAGGHRVFRATGSPSSPRPGSRGHRSRDRDLAAGRPRDGGGRRTCRSSGPAPHTCSGSATEHAGDVADVVAHRPLVGYVVRGTRC